MGMGGKGEGGKGRRREQEMRRAYSVGDKCQDIVDKILCHNIVDTLGLGSVFVRFSVKTPRPSMQKKH